jgi:hypothetical protein
MRLILILLLLFALPAFSADIDPEVGTHYAEGTVAYETTEFLVMRDGLTLNEDGSGYAQNILWKGPIPDEATQQMIRDSYLLTPSLDAKEKRALKRLVWSQGADAASTFALGAGCRELNPLFATHPEAMILLKGIYVYTQYHRMSKSPKFHSSSRGTNIIAGVTGAIAARNFLLNCGV